MCSPPRRRPDWRNSRCSAGGQQVVAPGDGVAQGLLAGGRSEGAGQQGQAGFQAGSTGQDGDRCAMRAAARSMASGAPSSRAQMVATTLALAGGQRRSRAARPGRAPTNRSARLELAQLGYREACAPGRAASARGTSTSCSPYSRARSRLVTSVRDPRTRGDQRGPAPARASPARNCPPPAALACRARTRARRRRARRPANRAAQPLRDGRRHLRGLGHRGQRNDVDTRRGMRSRGSPPLAGRDRVLPMPGPPTRVTSRVLSRRKEILGTGSGHEAPHAQRRRFWVSGGWGRAGPGGGAGAGASMASAAWSNCRRSTPVRPSAAPSASKAPPPAGGQCPAQSR